MSRSARNAVSVFFGWLLVAAGVLIAGSAGLCSAVFVVLAVKQSGSDRGNWLNLVVGLLDTVLPFGGVPIAAGVGLGVLGWRMARGKRE